MAHFEYGFKYKGFNYGWLNGELYRLPSKSKNKHFPLKKLSVIKVGNKDGYRLKRDKVPLDHLQERTVEIDYKTNDIRSKHLPFN